MDHSPHNLAKPATEGSETGAAPAADATAGQRTRAALVLVGCTLIVASALIGAIQAIDWLPIAGAALGMAVAACAFLTMDNLRELGRAQAARQS